MTNEEIAADLARIKEALNSLYERASALSEQVSACDDIAEILADPPRTAFHVAKDGQDRITISYNSARVYRTISLETWREALRKAGSE